MRKFCIGDIHGEYDKLMDVLTKADFDYENDQLISLGDIVDRGPDSFKCVEELLKIKNLIAIRGNHDACFRDSVITGHVNLLYGQGGRETMLSYTRDTECGHDPCKIPWEHIQFFKDTQINYYIDEDNNCFVHGGFDRHQLIEDQEENVLLWDRDLFQAAMGYRSMNDHTHPFKNKNKFNTIFIGHTPTVYWSGKNGSITTPIVAGNVINLDTGCGKGDYPLTMIEITSGLTIQSFNKK